VTVVPPGFTVRVLRYGGGEPFGSGVAVTVTVCVCPALSLPLAGVTPRYDSPDGTSTVNVTGPPAAVSVNVAVYGPPAGDCVRLTVAGDSSRVPGLTEDDGLAVGADECGDGAGLDDAGGEELPAGDDADPDGPADGSPALAEDDGAELVAAGPLPARPEGCAVTTGLPVASARAAAVGWPPPPRSR
jgi:hypothetical protein